MRAPARPKADFTREAALIASGQSLVAGIDEVGRGALAGPLCVAACILDPANLPDGADDSKKLNAARREALFGAILKSALAVSIVLVSPEEIDRHNIRGATLLGMRRALDGLARRPDIALIDGRDIPGPALPGPGDHRRRRQERLDRRRLDLGQGDAGPFDAGARRPCARLWLRQARRLWRGGA